MIRMAISSNITVAQMLTTEMTIGAKRSRNFSFALTISFHLWVDRRECCDLRSRGRFKAHLVEPTYHFSLCKAIHLLVQQIMRELTVRNVVVAQKSEAQKLELMNSRRMECAALLPHSLGRLFPARLAGEP